MPFWIRTGLIAAIGALLVVPVLAQPSSASKTAPAPAAPKSATPSAAHGKPIDINTASEAELDALPGIGKARAQAIIKGRPYASKDELHRKKIISEKVYNGIKDRIIAHQH